MTRQDIIDQFTHVVFEGGFPRIETTVPLAEAAAFYEANPTHHVQAAVCNLAAFSAKGDRPWYAHRPAGGGGWSYAKQWMFTGTCKLARIGVGAYGDLEIWRAIGA